MSRTRPARAYLKVDHYLLGGHDAVTVQLYNAEAKDPTCAVIQRRVFSWHLTQADQVCAGMLRVRDGQAPKAGYT
jgi:hypothetical protein